MVVGGSLDGKTTLLQVVAGSERPEGGMVCLGGRLLTGLSDRGRAELLGREIMWIDRGGPGLHVEVSRFVGWPLALHGHKRRDAERVAARMLARVGMREHSGRRWRDLSHRQQVLASLARAFAGDPRLVVVDDLLNGLGSRATEETIDLIRSLIEESGHRCGVLMSVSEMESTVYADRVFSIYKGVVEPMSGPQDNDAEIIPFPRQDERQGSRNVGFP
jgi:predicted ABC-type transport system involved in lysophospholipase L1 biosynthesis ATPase subunit